MAKKTDDSKKRYISKKCPNCFTYIPLHAKECTSCKIKVGPVDKHGNATRPTNWGAYTIAALAWVGFAIYIWWAFLRE